MADTLLNPNCIQMIKEACVSGRRVELFTTLLEVDEKTIDDICSAQEEADERIKEICKGKCDIMTTLHDRADNLQGDNIL